MYDISDPEINLTTLLLIRPNDIHEVLAVVSPHDFEVDECRLAFRGMSELAAEGIVITVTALRDKLLNSLEATRAGDICRLITDGGAVPVECNGEAKRLALKVRNRSKCRDLVSLMETVVTKANEYGASGESVRNFALEGLWGIRGSDPDGTVNSGRNLVVPFLEQIFRERSSTEELSGLSTGVYELDQRTTGIRSGELWIVGALPGRGKTALATQTAIANIEHGAPVLFFSLEMSSTELFRRMEGQRMNAANAMRNPKIMPEAAWNALREDAAELSSLPIYIDESSSMKISDLLARAHLAIKQHGIKLVIVDYLQLIKAPGKETRERVSYAADALRQLAKDTGVPVLALSQLRRPSGGINARPSMIELKESGDIEAHAHTILLLYQPMGEDDRPTGEDEIIIGKQRNGPIGAVSVYFDPRSLSFRVREGVAA